MQDQQPATKLNRSQQARINGANSRGPTTAAGKTKCSRGALKHGLTAEKHSVLDIENPAEYDAVYNAAIDEFRPQSLFTLRLVEKLAHLEWRIERLAMIDNAYLNYKINEAIDFDNVEEDPLTQAANSSTDNEIAALVRGWISAVGSANALELLRRYTGTLQHQFNSTLANLQKLEARQTTQLRDHDLPYQKPQFPPIEKPAQETPIESLQILHPQPSKQSQHRRQPHPKSTPSLNPKCA